MFIQEAFRIIALILYFCLGYKAGVSLFHEFELSFLLQLISAFTFFYITLQIKFSKVVNKSFKSITLTIFSMFLPLLFSFSNTVLISNNIGISLLVIGVSISLISLIELWTSFDFLPSYKRFIFSGPYQVVRHPIYFGYIFALLGSIFLYFSFLNLIVAISIFYCLYKRAQLEESFLVNSNSDYISYQKTVRFMIIPGIL